MAEDFGALQEAQDVLVHGIEDDQQYLTVLELVRTSNQLVRDFEEAVTTEKKLAPEQSERIALLAKIISTLSVALADYERDNGDEARVGEWNITPTGRFWLLDPRAGEVNIGDIAYSLSRIARFNGATIGTPYSVAQHSVLVSRNVPEWAALPALLHDAHEAYIGDQTSPWKKAVDSNLGEVEEKIKDVIAERFGFEWTDELRAVVKHADNVLLATELTDLTTFGVGYREPPARPLDERIVPESWEDALTAFMERFEELTGSNVNGEESISPIYV